MARDVGGVYSLPAGTAAVSGGLADANAVNSRFNDLANEQNLVRPISAGGTGAANAAAARAALGLALGIDVQAFDALLQSIAALTTAANKGLHFTGPDAAALHDQTPFARTLLDDADAATARATLGAQAQATRLDQFVALAAPTVGQFLGQIAGAPAWLGTIVVVDQKASGTSGGAFTSGSWQTRALNTVRTNSLTGASLASNRVTLPAGEYLAEISAPAYRVDNNKTRLQNITAGTTLETGTSEVCAVASFVSSRSVIVSKFTLAVQSDLEVQHWCATSNATDGFGAAFPGTGSEVYTIAKITRIG